MTGAAAQEVSVRIEFHQDQYWIDAKGQKHQLEDMTPAHLANVLSFTRSRADRLYELDRGEDLNGYGVDDAGFATDGFVSVAEALDWLESTPLLLAIKARLDQ